MRRVPRHEFVPLDYAGLAYSDRPMSETLELAPVSRVLEIGTGSSYQAAMPADIVRDNVNGLL